MLFIVIVLEQYTTEKKKRNLMKKCSTEQRELSPSVSVRNALLIISPGVSDLDTVWWQVRATAEVYAPKNKQRTNVNYWCFSSSSIVHHYVFVTFFILNVFIYLQKDLILILICSSETKIQYSFLSSTASGNLPAFTTTVLHFRSDNNHWLISPRTL